MTRSHNGKYVTLTTSTDDPPFRITISTDNGRSRDHESWNFEAHDLDDRLGVWWKIEPRDRWNSLKKYKRFVIKNEEFQTGNVVFVENNEDGQVDGKTSFSITRQWIAKVLEIRAMDEVHVYLRIFWLYRSADLPEPLKSSKKKFREFELFPSNEMTVIDAMCVNGLVKGLKYVGSSKAKASDVENGEDFTWRQTFDFRTCTLLSDADPPNL